MPNGAYLHLLINHIPVILAPLGAFVLLVAWITRRRAVWLYAVATLTLSGLSAYPVMFTGHLAEHVVKETVPAADRKAIHTHEEGAEPATWVLMLTGALAAYAWWRLVKAPTAQPNERLALWLRLVLTVLALMGATAATVTSYNAGFILHHEIHPGAVANTPTP